MVSAAAPRWPVFLAVCTSSLDEGQFTSLAQSLTRLLVFLLLPWSTLCILELNPPQICDLQIFSPHNF